MESVIPCEPNGSEDSLLSSTDLQQAVVYCDLCYRHDPFLNCAKVHKE